MATVSFSSIGKVYGDGTRALAGLSLDVVDGEFMIFVGPSGCGKTTALRMVAGLEDITEGEIRIGTASSTASTRASATSRWCSRTTPSTRT
jgi:multiple sugar transport system ATP-binding protein